MTVVGISTLGVVTMSTWTLSTPERCWFSFTVDFSTVFASRHQAVVLRITRAPVDTHCVTSTGRKWRSSQAVGAYNYSSGYRTHPHEHLWVSRKIFESREIFRGVASEIEPKWRVGAPVKGGCLRRWVGYSWYRQLLFFYFVFILNP